MVRTTRPPDWLAGALRPRIFRVDAALVVHDSFYFGPPNRFTPEQWRSLREPLPTEGIPRVEGWLLASSASAHVDAVARYGRAVKDAARRHATSLAGSIYSWVRPRICADDRTVCAFSWSDGYAATKATLDGLASESQGTLISDLDQHWEIEIVRYGADFWFGERDPDSEQPPRTCLVDAETVALEALAAARALDELLARLREQDADLWSI